jgi:Flp pilus assembly protein TadG
MRVAQLRSDVRGASAVEFALTVPILLMLVVGVVQFGVMLWAQFGLQHAVEMAARCASINKTVCATTSGIKSYAAGQAYALYPAPDIFTVAAPACGSQVSATFTLPLITSYFGLPNMKLYASSCFPR